MMKITNLTVECDKCQRVTTMQVGYPQDLSKLIEEPIVSNHECFCGEEFSISIDADSVDNLHLNVCNIIKTNLT